MFEATLAEKFKNIFDLTKVSFDQPGESHEQDCLFIEIEKVVSKARDTKYTARVTGRAFVYAMGTRIPFGYFAKKIHEADPAEHSDLFFYDIDEQSKLTGNVVQRGFSFVYFFSGQYDPVADTITTVDINVEEDQ